MIDETSWGFFQPELSSGSMKDRIVENSFPYTHTVNRILA